PRRSQGPCPAPPRPLPYPPLPSPTGRIAHWPDNVSLVIRYPLYALSTRAVNLVAERRVCSRTVPSRGSLPTVVAAGEMPPFAGLRPATHGGGSPRFATSLERQ